MIITISLLVEASLAAGRPGMPAPLQDSARMEKRGQPDDQLGMLTAILMMC